MMSTTEKDRRPDEKPRIRRMSPQPDGQRLLHQLLIHRRELSESVNDDRQIHGDPP